MLAEIFMLKAEAAARVAKEAVPRFVPITLPAARPVDDALALVSPPARGGAVRIRIDSGMPFEVFAALISAHAARAECSRWKYLRTARVRPADLPAGGGGRATITVHKM